MSDFMLDAISDGVGRYFCISSGMRGTVCRACQMVCQTPRYVGRVTWYVGRVGCDVEVMSDDMSDVMLDKSDVYLAFRPTTSNKSIEVSTLLYLVFK
jgi:hypothetical protein